MNHITCSIQTPIRTGLKTVSDVWDGPDKGKIFCWEQGRLLRGLHPEFAALAEKGEIIKLSDLDEESGGGWKPGTLNYLAWWQGLRGEDLDVVLGQPITMICAISGKTYPLKKTLESVDSDDE